MEETLRKLKSLRLNEMANKLGEMERQNSLVRLSPMELLCTLVDAEHDHRQNSRITRLKREAQIKISAASIANIEYGDHRNLNRDKMTELVTGRYLEHHRNVLFSGATGVGKTYLISALANFACMKGISVRYVRISKLMDMMELEKANGNYVKFLEKLSKIGLLVLDDLGPDVMSKKQRSFFFDLIEERYMSGSTIVASQLPAEQWYHLFEDESVADAICDRLFHNASVINLKGDSMRKK